MLPSLNLETIHISSSSVYALANTKTSKKIYAFTTKACYNNFFTILIKSRN